MLIAPRIAFSMFYSDRDPMLLAWGRFRRGIPGEQGAVVASPATGAVAAIPVTGALATVPLATAPLATAPLAMAPLAAARTTETPGGVWRLLASNNREVARSAHVYRSFASAHRHVIELQAASSFDVEIVRGPVTGMRGWVVVVAGEPSMTCSRWYSSTTCAESARSALDLFRTADVAEGWRWASGGPRHFDEAPPDPRHERIADRTARIGPVIAP